MLIVLLFALSYAAFYFSINREGSTNGYSAVSYLNGLLQAKTSGDNQQAITAYQAIVNNPQSTDQQKATAAINIAGVGFSVSGDVSAQLQDVQTMEQIATDTNVSLGVRATALSILGNAYENSGQNPAIFAAIYKNPPFSAYLVPNNPQLSALNLEEASYGLARTSTAAISAAYIASGQYFANPSQSASTTAAYASTTIEYLGDADAVAVGESQAPGYADSTRYMLYRAERTVVVGRLAIEVGGQYESTYKQTFSDFFVFAQSKQSTSATDETLSVRYQYARILAADKDTADEKTDLDALAQELNALATPNTHPFVAFLQNAYSNQSGTTWIGIQKMFTVSPDFKAAVTKLVTAPST